MGNAVDGIKQVWAEAIAHHKGLTKGVKIHTPIGIDAQAL